MSQQSVTVRAARWSAAHPWRAIGIWLACIVLSLLAGGAAGLKTWSMDDTASGEVARAIQIQKDGNFGDQAKENVLITARSGTLDIARANEAARDVSARMTGLADVQDVTAPAVSPKKDAVLVPVTMRSKPDQKIARDKVGPLLAATSATQGAFPDLRVEQFGPGSLGKGLEETVGKDFGLVEKLSLPITYLILLVTFGSLLAAAVPLMLSLTAIFGAIGLTMLVSNVSPGGENDFSLIMLVGLAVGVDYSMFYVRREREERARGRGHIDAIEIAAQTSGHAVVVSGISVVVAMAGMYLGGDQVWIAFANATILVVAVSVIGSLTVLPALLAKIGHRIDRPRVPLLWKLSQRPDQTSKFWSAVLRPSKKWPAVTLLASTGLAALIALPGFGMHLTTGGEEALSRDVPAVATMDRLNAAFPSTGGVGHLVAVKAGPEQAADVRRALDDLVTRAGNDRLFVKDARRPEVRESADRTVHTMMLAVPFKSDSDDARASLARLRTDLLPATVGTVSGAEVAVGGRVAGENDWLDRMNSRLPLVIGFVLLFTLLVMIVTFRSVVLGVLSILLNLLSVGAAFGVLVLVFQNTWAESLLGFHSVGGIMGWLPLFLFVILFGLSMDYHVFVVSRIREAVLRGVPTRQAVAEGITSSAGVVSSAAIVMVVVFALFATVSDLGFKQMGVGLAAAIFLDATLIRALVLPSAMSLLGKWTWWAPAFMRGPQPDPTAAEQDRPAELVPSG